MQEEASEQLSINHANKNGAIFESEKKKKIFEFHGLVEQQKSSFFNLFNCELEIRQNSIHGIFVEAFDHSLDRYLENCSRIGSSLAQTQTELETLILKTKKVSIPRQNVLPIQTNAISSAENRKIESKFDATSNGGLSSATHIDTSKKKSLNVSSKKSEDVRNRIEPQNIKEVYKQRIMVHRQRQEQAEQELKNAAAILIQKNVKCFLQNQLYHRFLVCVRRFKRREYFRIWKHMILSKQKCRAVLQKRYLNAWKSMNEKFKATVYSIKLRFWTSNNMVLVRDVFQFLKTYSIWRRYKKAPYNQRYILFRKSHRIVSKWWPFFDRILCFRMSMFNKITSTFEKILLHKVFNHWRDFITNKKMMRLQFEFLRQKSLAKFTASCFVQFRDYVRYLRENSEQLQQLLRDSLHFMHRLAYLKKILSETLLNQPKQQKRIFFTGWKRRFQVSRKLNCAKQIYLLSKRNIALLVYYSLSQNLEQLNLLFSVRKLKIFWLKRKFWRLFIAYIWKKHFCVLQLHQCFGLLRKKPVSSQRETVEIYQNMYSDYVKLKEIFFKWHLWNNSEKSSVVEQLFQFKDSKEATWYYEHWEQNRTTQFELYLIIFWFIVFDRKRAKEAITMVSIMGDAEIVDIGVCEEENGNFKQTDFTSNFSFAYARDFLFKFDEAKQMSYIRYHCLFNKKTMILKQVRDEKIISDYYAKIASIHSSQRQLSSLLKYVKQQTHTNQILEQIIDIEKEIDTCRPLILNYHNEEFKDKFEEFFIPITIEDIERLRDTEAMVLQSTISSSTKPQILLKFQSEFNESDDFVLETPQEQQKKQVQQELVNSTIDAVGSIQQKVTEYKPLIFTDEASSTTSFTAYIPLRGSTPTSRKHSIADGGSSQISDSQMEAMFVQKRTKLHQIARGPSQVDFSKITILEPKSTHSKLTRNPFKLANSSHLTYSHINPSWINSLIDFCEIIEHQIEEQWVKKRERQKIILENLSAVEVTLFYKLNSLKVNMESQLYELHDLYCRLVAFVEFMRAKAIKNTSLTFQEVFFYNEVMKEVTQMKKRMGLS